MTVRPFVRALGLSLVLLGLLQARAPQPVGAQDSIRRFNLIATGQAASVELRAPDAHLVVGEQLFDISPVTSQAALSSLGTQSAFAAAPYLGDTIVALPKTVNALGGGTLPPVPDYPLIVNADTFVPSPPPVRQGPYALNATVGDGESTASGNVGAATGDPAVLSFKTTAHSKHDATDGSLVAEASTRFDGLAVGSVLEIGTITTSASVRVSGDSGSKPEIQSHSEFGLRVLGVPLRLDTNGLTAASNSIPVDVKALFDTLDAVAGIRLTYIPETRNADGTSLRTAGLEMGYVANFPVVGRMAVTVSLGQVTVRADNSVVSATPNAVAADENFELPVITETDATGSFGAVTPEQSAPDLVTPSIDAPLISAEPDRGPPMGSLFLVLSGAAIAALGSSRTLGTIGIQRRFGTRRESPSQ